MANYLLSPTTLILATIHLLQTDGQTDKTDNNHANSSTVT